MFWALFLLWLTLNIKYNSHNCDLFFAASDTVWLSPWQGECHKKLHRSERERCGRVHLPEWHALANSHLFGQRFLEQWRSCLCHKRSVDCTPSEYFKRLCVRVLTFRNILKINIFGLIMCGEHWPEFANFFDEKFPDVALFYVQLELDVLCPR